MKVYKRLKEIQKLAWEHDDLMDQETLFEVQDKLSGLLLEVAMEEKEEEDLLESFPWIYNRK